MPNVRLSVNNQIREISVPVRAPLLSVLRRALSLKGARFGCGAGNCGACTVLVDGRPEQSCTFPVEAAVGKTITTIEGLGSAEAPGLIQTLFLDEQAAQCGYCINGIIMSLTGLMARQPAPTRSEIVEYLDKHHLCRCGAHPRILRVVDRLLGAS